MNVMHFFKKQKKIFLKVIIYIFINNFFIRWLYKNKHDFYGGIEWSYTNKNKNILLNKNIRIGDIFIVPVNIKIIKNAKLKVQIGEKVLKGQPLTFGDNSIVPVHAPTSGIVTNIKKYILNHKSYKVGMGITIRADGNDTWIRLSPIKDYYKLNRKDIILLIYQHGIVGLGGAQFSTACKLQVKINEINTLIINGVESDPYTTSDEWLMENYASDILKGCEILTWVLKAQYVIIAISEDKLASILNMKNKLLKYPNFKIKIISKKYPSGSSKQLIKILTGKEIPYGQHASDIGIIMYNVSTVYAVKKAIIEGYPLIERVITITGDSAKNCGNMWVRLGTPISDLLLSTQGNISDDQSIIIGGPLIGSVLSNFKIPILKSTSCIFITSKIKIKEKQNSEKPCIRCGICSNLCPMKLLPQQLYWYAKSFDHSSTKLYNIRDCIECGICETVCPSEIPLMNYYREEIRLLNTIDLYESNAKISKKRFQEKKNRLSNQKNVLINNIHIDKIYHIIKKDSNVIDDKINKNDRLNKDKRLRKLEIQNIIKRAKEKKFLLKNME